jgi:cellulose synthase/poly-beta-1,6-N-acetylglucosamine synthase-like glycosyltransferase
MTRTLFWLAGFLVAWAYALFPTLVVLRGRLLARPHRRRPVEPSVSIIAAARNEADAIAAKAHGLLGLEYPADRLSICIASDGSTDATVAIAREAGRGIVRVLDLPGNGKAAALDAAVRATESEILVFTDANSRFRPDAIRALVRHFADPEVGGVAGNQVYTSADVDVATEGGERTYWSFDRLLKESESRAGNTISATGAIYAIRRDLYRPVPAGVNDDFYLSLGVIAQGQRLVFDAEAIAEEPVAASVEAEYARKVRVITRAMRCVVEQRVLLDPRRHGFYSLQLLSHKILRWAMPIPLAVLAVTSLRLAGRGPLYALAAVGQLVAYGLAGVGLVARDTGLGRKAPVAIPAYYCLVNAAAAHAAWNLLRGRRIDRWSPGRERGADQVVTGNGHVPAAEAQDVVHPDTAALPAGDATRR